MDTKTKLSGFISILAIGLLCGGSQAQSTPASSAPPAVLTDRFNDNELDPSLWNRTQNNPGVITIRERNSRLEIASAGNNGSNTEAFVYNKGWAIDATKDFKWKIDFNVNLYGISVDGDVGLSVVCWFTGDPTDGTTSSTSAVYGYLGYDFEGVDDDGVAVDGSYFGSEYILNGRFMSEFYTAPSPVNSGTVYYSYHSGTDTLSISGVGYDVDAENYSGLRVGSGSNTANVAFSGYTEGIVAGFSGSEVWVDNFSLDLGTLVGPDTDGDGLLDSWECFGIPYTDVNGDTQRFVLPDADEDHKDLYVEVDSMDGFGFTAGAVMVLEKAYDLAPISNPDKKDGIKLHVLLDDRNLKHVAVWETDGCWPLDFPAVRKAWYGSEGDRKSNDKVALLEAKAKAYRYCVAADTSGPKAIGGCGETPGDNFVIFIKNYTDEDQAAVFMHELGHNLGLDHGGGDGINGKPNYPSIMNYVMSYRRTWNNNFWHLDYSRAAAGNFPILDEIALNEQAGIGTQTGWYRNTLMPYGVYEDLGGGNIVRTFKYVRLNGSDTDFGNLSGTGFQDGFFDMSVIQDLNYVTDDPNVPPGIPDSRSIGDELYPYDDWANVGLPLRSTLGTSAPAISFPTDEMGREAIDWIEANFPMPPNSCPADLNGDGIVDLGDIQAFVALFLAPDPAADFNNDGILDLGDIQAFVTAFLEGC